MMNTEKEKIANSQLLLLIIGFIERSVFLTSYCQKQHLIGSSISFGMHHTFRMDVRYVRQTVSRAQFCPDEPDDLDDLWAVYWHSCSRVGILTSPSYQVVRLIKSILFIHLFVYFFPVLSILIAKIRNLPKKG